MRLQAVILSFLVFFPCLAQVPNGQRRELPSVPVETATPQQSEVITVPISQGMVDVLEKFRLDVPGTNGPQYADHSSLVSAAMELSTSTTLRGKIIVGQVRQPVPANTAETISLSLTPAQATEIETMRLNAYERPMRDKSGTVTMLLVYPDKASLFRDSLATQGGLFWRLVLRYPTPDIALLLRSGTAPGDPSVTAKVKEVLAGK